MTITWTKPQEIATMGLVMVSTCRRFMIIRKPDKKCKLSYTKDNHERVCVGTDYPAIKDAKAAAEEMKALWD